MIIKLFSLKGCIIAEFTDLKRFTLAVTEEVKTELKPVLSNKGAKLVFNLQNIEFIDSNGLGCIISLVKTAKNCHSEIKLCNLSPAVTDIMNLLHLSMIFDIEKDVESCIRSFEKN